MADAPRARKLAERIQQIVARMLDTRIKDPRLGFVTVTDVRVTGDLQNATIFYTVLGDDEERASSAAALASAKGIIRSEVGKQTGIRLTPTIEFVPDAVPETAASLEEALRAAAGARRRARPARRPRHLRRRRRPVPPPGGGGRPADDADDDDPPVTAPGSRPPTLARDVAGAPARTPAAG